MSYIHEEDGAGDNSHDEDSSSVGSDSTIPWLNETEFLNEFWMTQSDFWKLVDLVKDDPVFTKRNGKRHQAPVALQLAVLLHFIGTSGEGGSNPKLRIFFKIGRGTVSLYKDARELRFAASCIPLPFNGQIKMNDAALQK
jgi:hypothetical protein